jgi:uncharacterized protein (TIGR03435 family)
MTNQSRANKHNPVKKSCIHGVSVAIAWFVICPIYAWPAQAQSLSAAGSSTPLLKSISVRISRSADRMMLFPMGPEGTVTLRNVSVRFLVEFAYNLNDSQLSGGPDWIDSQRYDVDMKQSERQFSGLIAPDANLQQQRRVMVQSLLADRFGLKLIEVANPTPTYSLVVAQDGPKIHLVKIAPESVVKFSILAEKGRLTITGGSNDQLADVLSGQLGCQVIDRTGLSGVYDATLLWTPDSRASLLAAVQSQLGLSLQEHVSSSKTYLIDEVGKPAED